jgi:outer membrane protein TolC
MQPGPWDLHLVPDAAPALGVFDGDLDSGLALAIDSSPAYRRGQLRLQSTDLQVELARDRTRPQVDLIARVGVTGIGGSYADNVEVLSEAEGRSWRGGVTLGFPLGHNSDRERLYQRVLEKQRDEVDLERVRLDIVRQVREQHRRVGINHRRVEVSQLAERLAEQNVTEEEDRLTLGLSTVRQVLDAQDDLAESRRRLQAIVGYNKALVEWRRLTGA